MNETIRTARRWREMGDAAAREDWNLGHRDALTTEDVRSALLGYFDTDLNDPTITEQDDAAKDTALSSAVGGYVAEYRRLGGVVGAAPTTLFAKGAPKAMARRATTHTQKLLRTKLSYSMPTDAQIRALMQEAARAGDRKMVAIAARALGGSKAALKKVAEAIRAGQG